MHSLYTIEMANGRSNELRRLWQNYEVKRESGTPAGAEGILVLLSTLLLFML